MTTQKSPCVFETRYYTGPAFVVSESKPIDADGVGSETGWYIGPLPIGTYVPCYLINLRSISVACPRFMLVMRLDSEDPWERYWVDRRQFFAHAYRIDAENTPYLENPRSF